MIRYSTPATAQASRTARTLSGGGATWRTEFVPPHFPGEGEECFPSPQAFSIEQSPGATSLPHFHDEDQYQVIPCGEGTLGRHPVGGISIHYTNRQTAYGPIIAGADGMTFFTLRQIATKGIWYLGDGDRPERAAPKRTETVGPIALKPAAELQGLRVAELREVFKPYDDGLASWVVGVPPGATVDAPVHPAGTGRYVMVINGSMIIDGNELTPFCPVFVSHDERDFRLSAGSAGLEALVMQYPGGERVLSRKCLPLTRQGPVSKGQVARGLQQHGA